MLPQNSLLYCALGSYQTIEGDMLEETAVSDPIQHLHFIEDMEVQRLEMLFPAH